MNDDFKFEDLGYEPTSHKKTRGKKHIIKSIFIVIFSLSMGILVYLISNYFFGPKTSTDNTSISTELNIEEDKVLDLYQSISYAPTGKRDEKFIKEANVQLEDFNNYEKYWYALQYAKASDFIDTKEIDENTNLPIYSLEKEKMLEYMQHFFGKKVTYSTQSDITITFPFEINEKNTGIISYDNENSKYKVIFISKTNPDQSPKSYATKLDSAVQLADGSIELREKIIYLNLVQQQDETNNPIDQYTCSIYKDYDHTMLIKKLEGITKEELNFQEMIDQYWQEITTITYTFHKDDTKEKYYFYSSKIQSE